MTKRVNVETFLYVLALFIALTLRLYTLGHAPLNDTEAGWALQAQQLAGIGAQPAYIFLTGVTFALLNASNFVARLWPALAGAFLVLLPVCFRKELGRSAALILAFGLAMDPGLVIVSRQAGGPMLALSFLLLALGALWIGRPALAGILGALGLLSGPAALFGLTGLGLTWAAFYAWRKYSKGGSVEAGLRPAQGSSPHIGFDSTPTPSSGRNSAFLTLLVSILLIGSFFFRYPQGLAAWVSALPIYLNGWVIPSGVPAGSILFTLFSFQSFALFFALIGIARYLFGLAETNTPTDPSSGRSSAFILPTILWLLVNLALALLYPGRLVSDLCWSMIPMWILAALEIPHYLPGSDSSAVHFTPPLGSTPGDLTLEEPRSAQSASSAVHFMIPIQSGLTLILAWLFWNTLIATNQIAPVTDLSWTGLRLLMLGGIVALGALTTLLVALGWSWEIGRDGLVWGLAAVLAVVSISALWGATQLRPNQPQELWSQPPAIGEAELMLKTLEDLSNWSAAMPHAIDIVSTVDTPALRWLLREFKQVRYQSAPSTTALPSIVITWKDLPALNAADTTQGASLSLSAAYRGQDFAWFVRPGWSGILPPDLIGWLTFRDAPLSAEQLIVWARSDLFPGGQLINTIIRNIETIAIDGPAASGKSTLGKKLADTLGYLFFDTGVMYRAVTWIALQRGLPFEDEAELRPNAISTLAESIVIDILKPSTDDGRDADVLADGADITWQIRRPEVDANVSLVSSYAGVRRALTAQQRRIGQRGRVVMVGRDIGTVVLPEADLKIYLDASAEERARRRYTELRAQELIASLVDGAPPISSSSSPVQNPPPASYETILEAMRRRDQFDSTRAIAPLKPAADAIILDSDALSADQVLEAVLRLIPHHSQI